MYETFLTVGWIPILLFELSQKCSMYSVLKVSEKMKNL